MSTPDDTSTDVAVNEPVAADTTPTESAPVENNDAAEKDVMEMSLDELDGGTDSDLEESAEETPQESEEGSTEQNSEQSEQGEKPLAPKSENRFQKLANDNRELRERIAKLTSQETQVATEQELMGEINPETGDYYSPQEAERIARHQTNENLSQSLAQERYVLEVQANQEALSSEAVKALEEFPIFDERSKDYRPELATQADNLLKQSLIFDQNGTLVGSQLSPYQLYKTIADSTQVNNPQIQAKAQRSVEKMLANADRVGDASQATKTKSDPMMDAFYEEAGMSRS